MNIVRRTDPYTSLFDEMLGDCFARPTWAATSGVQSSVAKARFDVVEKGPNYEVSVDLPGVKKEDIHIDVKGTTVSISAEAKTEEVRKDGDRVLYAERTARQYARSFELPEAVAEDGAVAAYLDGVLKLTLPKKVAPLGKRIAIQ